MNRRRILLIVVVLVVAIAVGGATLAVDSAAREALRAHVQPGHPQQGRLQRGGAGEGEPLIVSGFVEAEQIVIAPEQGGRVMDLAVGEGDQVAAGDLLVRLDTRTLDAQLEAARAGVDVAQAHLELALAGARPEEIRCAEARLMQAEALRDGAYQGWQDLQALRADPQELTGQIAQAEAEVAARQAALVRAVALKDAAEIAYDAYWDSKEALAEAEERLSQIPEPLRPPLPGVQLSFHKVPNQYWKAWIGVNAAQAALDGAKAALRDLNNLKANPQELDAQISAVEAEYRAAQAGVDMARAELDKLRAGTTKEEITALEAQVQQAQAAVETLLVRLDRQTLSAPASGLVLVVNVREGELAQPGARLLTLGRLDEVNLTVYVPEERLGEVYVGQPALVNVDGFPDREFCGTVVAIASEAEFTPRNVQARADRLGMVFAVNVRIPNPDHALKPGMPADAHLLMEEH